MNDNLPTELRLPGGSTILGYIRKFSATEKAVFGLFAVAALVTAVVMADRASERFTVEIPADGGALREGLVGLPHTVNPVVAVTDVDRDIASLVYAGLTRYEDGKIVPDLAKSWRVSSDGLTYTFDLRAGLRFQDGSPLTAQDVVFTIDKIRDPALKSPRAMDWAGVSASASTSDAVTFTLKQPYGSFLANTTLGIIPKHIWGNVSDEQFIFSQYNIEPVGAGPYRVSGIGRDSGGIPTEYRLSTWSGYHGEKPHLKEIVFSFFPDEDHALAAIQSGAIDSLPSVTPAQASALSLATDGSHKIVSAPFERIFGVFFNQNVNPILAEAAVRNALSLAVDRTALIAEVLDGYGTPIDGPLPPSLIGQSASTSTASSTSAFRGDLPAATALLEKNGWKRNAAGIYEKKVGKAAAKPLALSLYTADVPELKRTADFVKAAWTVLGADVDVKIFDPSELYQNVIRARSYDALLFGEAVGKDNDLYAFWHSSQRNAPGLNVSMYANSKADKLLEGIRAASDADVRAAAWKQFDQLVSADSPAVFLYAPDFVYAVPMELAGSRLGVITSPTDRFASVGSWYTETERVWKVFSNR